MYFQFNKTNMTTDFPYIISQYIREYDISKCNINMLLLGNKIDENLYNHLYNADKFYREKYIGNMIKEDSSIYKIIKEGIIEYRNRLFKENNIQECDIVSIKNDAVFIVNKTLDKTIFDNIVEFKNKNIYTSFLKIGRLELYYNVNSDIIDVKGINDIKLQKHNNYLLDLIKTLIYLIEINDLNTATSIINDFYFKYLNYDLDYGYFRTFNSDSIFIVNDIENYTFDVPIIEDKTKYNISENIRFLMEFNKILNSILMSKIRYK